MTLASGRLLSHFRIVDPLGAGAMGEVYRAVDTRLDREVAIKVLPEHFAADPERLRRFEREAKSLASLNHPNIAQIYAVDQAAELYFLALELVPGETLETRLRRGRLPLVEALEVARQIAEGLEAAHEAGVIHRDLKPANVRVTEDGKVKLLDFGLAKPARESGTEASSTDSVLTTEQGRLLGTPTYMAPEQARGKAIDKRVDVWAFGCVLYECLTGERAFAGETLTDVLSAVIEREPNWSRLGSVPPRVRALLERCLAKDARKRLRDVGDARLELEAQLAASPDARLEADTAANASSAGPSRRIGALLLVAAVGMALGFGVAQIVRSGATPDPATGAGGGRAARLAHVSIPIARTNSRTFPRVAPDGSAVAYVAPDPSRPEPAAQALFLRRFDAHESIRLPGAESPQTLAFAPDSRSIAVVVGDASRPESLKLVHVLLDQGAPRAVALGAYAPNANLSSGLTWTDQDLLVTASNNSELLTRPLEGGDWTTTALANLDPSNPYVVELFRALPGGGHVLGNTFAYGPAGFEPRSLAIDVRTGDVTTIAEGGHAALTAGQKLLFTRGDALYCADFDPEALRIVGVPRMLFEGLRTSETWQPAWFDVARDGTIVYSPGGRQGARRELVVATRDGEVKPWIPQVRAFDGMLEVDRSGTFVVVSALSSGGLVEVWGSDAAAPVLRPLVSGPRADFVPGAIDGPRRQFFFARMAHDETHGVWRASLDEPEQQVRLARPVPAGALALPCDVSPDGRRLLVFLERGDESQVLEWSLDTPTIEERALFTTDTGTNIGGYSADGAWIACAEIIDGRRAAVVRRRRADGSVAAPIPIPGFEGRSGQIVRWVKRPEGAPPTLIVGDRLGETLTEVEMLSADPPTFSAPRPWPIDLGRTFVTFETFPDGRALLLLRGESETVIDRVEVVFGGFEMLAR